MTLEQLKESLDSFFSDRSRDAQDVLSDLYKLEDHLNMLTEALEEELYGDDRW